MVRDVRPMSARDKRLDDDEGVCSSASSSSPSSIFDAELRKYVGYFFLLGCGAATYYSFPFPEDTKHKKFVPFRYAPLPNDLHTVSNWSGTHEVQTRVFLQPEKLEELEKIWVGMVNLALMDKVLEVDREKKQVSVQVGLGVAAHRWDQGAWIGIAECCIYS
ncbi:hypothetical protein ACLOJK_029117 [Asimina triloba]